MLEKNVDENNTCQSTANIEFANYEGAVYGQKGNFLLNFKRNFIKKSRIGEGKKSKL